MAFSAYDFAFALAPRTHLCVEIIVSSSQLDPTCDSTLSTALLTGDDIVGILSPCTFAMGTSHLFLHENIELLAKVEVFEFEEDFDFELGAFQLVEVELLIDIRVVHLFNADAVV